MDRPPRCIYPGCEQEPITFRERRTRYEILADLKGEGVCATHYFFLRIDPEEWANTGMAGKATLEMKAVEDLEFLKVLDDAVKPIL